MFCTISAPGSIFNSLSDPRKLTIQFVLKVDICLIRRNFQTHSECPLNFKVVARFCDIKG